MPTSDIILPENRIMQKTSIQDWFSRKLAKTTKSQSKRKRLHKSITNLKQLTESTSMFTWPWCRTTTMRLASRLRMQRTYSKSSHQSRCRTLCSSTRSACPSATRFWMQSGLPTTPLLWARPHPRRTSTSCMHSSKKRQQLRATIGDWMLAWTQLPRMADRAAPTSSSSPSRRPSPDLRLYQMALLVLLRARSKRTQHRATTCWIKWSSTAWLQRNSLVCTHAWETRLRIHPNSDLEATMRSCSSLVTPSNGSTPLITNHGWLRSPRSTLHLFWPIMRRSRPWSIQDIHSSPCL